MAQPPKLPDWLATVIKDETWKSRTQWFSMKVGSRTSFKISNPGTYLVQIVKAVGSKYVVADNSCSIQAEIRNIPKILEQHRAKGGVYLGNLTNGTVIALEGFSIIAKRDARSFQLSLDVGYFQVFKTGLPLPNALPKPFSTNPIFQDLLAHATGERGLKERARTSAPAKENAMIIKKAKILTERSERVTKSLQSNSIADDQVFERNVNKYIEDAASDSWNEPEKVVSPIDVTKTDMVNKMADTELEKKRETKLEQQSTPVTGSPLREIASGIPWKLTTLTDFTNLPLVRSVGIIPKDQAEFLQDKNCWIFIPFAENELTGADFLPVDPGKPPLSAPPLPFETHQKLLEMLTTIAELEPNDQLVAEKQYALSASQSSNHTPVKASSQSNYDSSSEEELLEWDGPSPLQNHTKAPDFLPPDTPTSTGLVHGNGEDMVLSPSLRNKFGNTTKQDNPLVERDGTPPSTMGMPAEVPQALQPSTETPTSLSGKLTKVSANLAILEDISAVRQKVMASQGLSSSPHSPESLVQSPNIILSTNIQTAEQNTDHSPQNQLLSALSFENNTLKRKSSSLTSSLSKRARQTDYLQPSSPPESRISSLRNSRHPSAQSSAVNSRRNSSHVTDPTLIHSGGMKSLLGTSLRSSMSRKESDDDLQEVFKEFKDAYPMYKGDFQRFTAVCDEMHSMEIPRFSYDDYIVRQQVEYPIWILEQIQNGRNGLLYRDYYFQEVQQLEYTKGVINPPRLMALALSVQAKDLEISMDLD